MEKQPWVLCNLTGRWTPAGNDVPQIEAIFVATIQNQHQNSQLDPRTMLVKRVLRATIPAMTLVIIGRSAERDRTVRIVSMRALRPSWLTHTCIRVGAVRNSPGSDGYGSVT